MKNIILLVIGLVVSSSAYSAVFKSGYVTSVKMFSSVVIIYVDGIDEGACGTNHKRVAIKNTDPLFAVVLSSALTAKVAGEKVQIGYHEKCTNNINSWDFESFWVR